MFSRLLEIERDVEYYIDRGLYNEAVINILVGVHNHHKLPTVVGNFLYYKEFDRLIERLADCLFKYPPPLAEMPLTSNTLIVASEFSNVGGHSRVMADIAHATPMTTIVLTDMLWRLQKNPMALDWQFEIFQDTTVITLNQHSPWEKCKALRQITQRLQPSNIIYFNHHQDPIPFIGTLRHKGSRKTLAHHCDHNPSLGSTLDCIAHFDFTDEMAAECRSNLGRETNVLPLFVVDQGRKAFNPNTSTAISAVTSGSSEKFVREGSLALKHIVACVLATISGQFFHVGQIDEDWASDIRDHLILQGVDPQRYVLLGKVPSLWKTLAAIDAQIYIASAPLGGGRAAIEAQGCGYPVLFFDDRKQRSALGTVSLYASLELGWSDLKQLQAILADLKTAQLLELGAAARELYETRHSETEFRKGIMAMTGQTLRLN